MLVFKKKYSSNKQVKFWSRKDVRQILMSITHWEFGDFIVPIEWESNGKESQLDRKAVT